MYKKNLHLFLVFFLLFVFFLLTAIYSEGSHGGGDDFHHWRIAKFSWQYPYLFFDLWGKPLYNLLSSLFAQFGMKGSRVFNILVGLTTGFIAMLLCRRLKISMPPVVVLMVCFTPIYFVLMLTGMTEILFSMVLMLSLWLFFSEKYILSAMVLSFLPFARNEGFIFFPLFIAAYIFVRKPKAIPFLVIGYLVITVAGYFHYKNWLWVFHANPYGRNQLYGSGELFHFIKHLPHDIGYPILVLFCVGLIWYLIRLRHPNRNTLVRFILLPGTFAVFLAAHSYVWWKGTGGSLGLTRVIASVSPVVAIISLEGLVFLLSYFKSVRDKLLILVPVILLILWTPFNTYKIPVPPSDSQKTIRRAVEWMKRKGLDKRKFYYYDPWFVVYLGSNPFDATSCREKVPVYNHPEKATLPGELVLWDAHYGSNEGKLKRERLMDSKYFRPLKAFYPSQPFKVLNNYNYEVWIFERIDSTSQSAAFHLSDTNNLYDHCESFENIQEIGFAGLTNEKAFDGQYSLFISQDREFSYTWQRPFSETGWKQGMQLLLTAYLSPADSMSEEQMPLFVFSIEHKGKVYHYSSSSHFFSTGKDAWLKTFIHTEIPKVKSGRDMVKCYFWNRHRKSFFMDNLCYGEDE